MHRKSLLSFHRHAPRRRLSPGSQHCVVCYRLFLLVRLIVVCLHVTLLFARAARAFVRFRTPLGPRHSARCIEKGSSSSGQRNGGKETKVATTLRVFALALAGSGFIVSPSARINRPRSSEHFPRQPPAARQRQANNTDDAKLLWISCEYTKEETVPQPSLPLPLCSRQGREEYLTWSRESSASRAGHGID